MGDEKPFIHLFVVVFLSFFFQHKNTTPREQHPTIIAQRLVARGLSSDSTFHCISKCAVSSPLVPDCTLMHSSPFHESAEIFTLQFNPVNSTTLDFHHIACFRNFDAFAFYFYSSPPSAIRPICLSTASRILSTMTRISSRTPRARTFLQPGLFLFHFAYWSLLSIIIMLKKCKILSQIRINEFKIHYNTSTPALLLYFCCLCDFVST